MEFKQLTLIEPLLKAVDQAGYVQPSPIQQKAIPSVLAGRDLLACAQTGTGKTAAFALPILQLLSAAPAAAKNRPIRTLVLTPTRELALQIEESFKSYGKFLPLRATVIFGGVGQNPQVAALRKGVDVLVATPGRLNDLIGQGYIDLSKVEIFVLDEADRMLDMGFVHDVKKVLKLLPQQKQTLLFSATMPPEIVQLANGLLHNPAKVFVTPVSSTVDTIQQKLYKVDKANKRFLLAGLLKEPAFGSTLVFTRTKHGADRVVRELAREGVKAMAIHGNKSQNARQAALGQLKDGSIKVLVATDIAARGLDINELSHVVNYDLPNIPETYVHRIGRTGRAGHGGVAISFCCFDELEYLADIEKLIGFAVPEETGHQWPMQLLQKTEKTPNGGQRQAAAGQQPKGRAPIKEEKKPKVEKEKNGRTKQAQKKEGTAGAKPAAPQKQKAQAPSSDKKRGKEQPPQKNTPQNKKKSFGRGPREAENPYENRTGGGAIITRRPVWASAENEAEKTEQAAPLQKGEENTVGKNNRSRGGKNHANRGKKPVSAQPQAEKAPEIPKKNGVYNFTEEELAEDKGLQVISRADGETKYSSFEEFLKNH
ncbi:MAG: DEAD/DEAH box helicase [Oscillospiraceae bacterium]